MMLCTTALKTAATKEPSCNHFIHIKRYKLIIYKYQHGLLRWTPCVSLYTTYMYDRNIKGLSFHINVSQQYEMNATSMMKIQTWLALIFFLIFFLVLLTV